MVIRAQTPIGCAIIVRQASSFLIGSDTFYKLLLRLTGGRGV
jgi:hypothetical protein